MHLQANLHPVRDIRKSVTHMEPNALIATITPEIATEYLKLEIKPDDITRSKALRFYRGMLLCCPQEFNGEPIRFNTNGDLIDGQILLKAIIDTGISFKCVLVFGIKEGIHIKPIFELRHNKPAIRKKQEMKRQES